MEYKWKSYVIGLLPVIIEEIHNYQSSEQNRFQPAIFSMDSGAAFSEKSFIGTFSSQISPIVLQQFISNLKQRNMFSQMFENLETMGVTTKGSLLKPSILEFIIKHILDYILNNYDELSVKTLNSIKSEIFDNLIARIMDSITNNNFLVRNYYLLTNYKLVGEDFIFNIGGHTYNFVIASDSKRRQLSEKLTPRLAKEDWFNGHYHYNYLEFLKNVTGWIESEIKISLDHVNRTGFQFFVENLRIIELGHLEEFFKLQGYNFSVQYFSIPDEYSYESYTTFPENGATLLKNKYATQNPIWLGQFPVAVNFSRDFVITDTYMVRTIPSGS